jgi:hypothetical protein
MKEGKMNWRGKTHSKVLADAGFVYGKAHLTDVVLREKTKICSV